MKKLLKNLQDALSYQLKGLYDAEKKLQQDFPVCSQKASSLNLRNELEKYAESSSDKILKLERVFNYLMEEPGGRKNLVMIQLLKETQHLLKLAASEELRDVLIISCIQNINNYKISGYKTAQALAIELELDTPADLLHELISWEKQTSAALIRIALEEVILKAAPSASTPPS